MDQHVHQDRGRGEFARDPPEGEEAPADDVTADGGHRKEHVDPVPHETEDEERSRLGGGSEPVQHPLPGKTAERQDDDAHQHDAGEPDDPDPPEGIRHRGDIVGRHQPDRQDEAEYRPQDGQVSQDVPHGARTGGRRRHDPARHRYNSVEWTSAKGDDPLLLGGHRIRLKVCHPN